MQLTSNANESRIPDDTRSNRRAHVVVSAAIGLVLLMDGRAVSAATITVDASKQTAGNPRFWTAAVGTGTGIISLRADWQTHLKIANRELGMQRVRGHGALGDDKDSMGLVRGSTYDWTNFDKYLAAIAAANMRPIMELDFMPKDLAKNGDSRDSPKDMNAWKQFIQALIKHCVDKFGADDVGSWYWEVWNEPDYPYFWNGTDKNEDTNAKMADYYALYDATVDAATAALPNIIIGGPSTTTYTPIGAFLQHCKSANKRVSFVSSHAYPGAGGNPSANPAALVDDNNSRMSQISSGGYSSSTVMSFNTEWNSAYTGQGGKAGDSNESMDTHVNAPFIIKAVKLLSDKNQNDKPPLEVFSYWAVTDVFGESGSDTGMYIQQQGGNVPFGAVFGLITFQGMRKAAFNGFKMLNYLGPKRLQSAGGTGSDGVDSMATKSANDDEIQVLVYDYYNTIKTTGSDSVTVNVSNLPSALAGKEIFVTQFLVDETHSNPYSVWVGQNKPNNPSEAQWQEMRKAQHLALAQPVSKKTVDTSFSMTFTLSRQGASLIILGTKRPLTGRNALVEIEAEDYDGQSGATKEDSNDTSLGQSISLTSGGYVYFENVDYTDDGVGSVQLRVKTQTDTSLELHAESQTGTLLGKCTVSSTSNAWATQKCTLSQAATGVSRLYVVAGGAMHLNWLMFQPGGGGTGTGGSGGGGAGGAGGSPAGGAGGSAAGGAGGSPAGGVGGGAAGSSRGGAGGGPAGGAGGGPAGGAGGGGPGGAAGRTSGGSGNGGTTSGGSGNGGTTSSGPGNGGTTSGGPGNGGTTSAGPGGGGTTSGGSGNGGTTSAGPGNGGTVSTGPGGGGNSGSGGSPSTAGGGKSSGCSCRMGNAGRSSGTRLLVGLVAAVFGLRRLRARRSR